MDRENKGDVNCFIATMQYLSTNFPEREVGSGLIGSYFDDLAEFSAMEVEAAARAWVRTGTRFPFVADLLSLLNRAAA